MKITLSIDDELWDIYREESIARKMNPGDVIRERLAKAVALDPRDRGIIISGGRTMQILEEKLGGGHLKSAEDLLNKVTNLAGIRFGLHEFVISPGQFRELTFRAQKTGKTIEQLVESIYKRMQATFWEYVP